MSNLAQRLATTRSAVETAEVMRDVEIHAKEFPDGALQCSKYLVPLFASSVSSIRRSAFNSALAIMAAQPAAADHFIFPYQCAMMHEDNEIARHAISYLPHFVALCRVRADEVLNSALEAVRRKPLLGVEKHIAETMELLKNSDRRQR